MPCHRAFQTLVYGLLPVEGEQRSSGGLRPHLRLVHGLLGLDAADRLGLATEPWSAQIDDALDVLQIDPSEHLGHTTYAELLPVLTRSADFRGDGGLVLPALAAASRLSTDGILNHPPELVVRACVALL